jgi:hypothetical protein
MTSTTQMLILYRRRNVPDHTASQSHGRQRTIAGRDQIRQRLERPSTFALAVTGQVSIESMIEEFPEHDDFEMWFTRLLRVRAMYEREMSMAILQNRPENLEPLRQMLNSLWCALCNRVGLATLDGSVPPLPREPHRLLEAPTRNFNDAVLDMGEQSKHLRGRVNAGVPGFTYESPLSISQRAHPSPPLHSPLSRPESSRTQSYLHSPTVARYSISSPSDRAYNTPFSTPFHPNSNEQQGVVPISLGQPALDSHVASMYDCCHHHSCISLICDDRNLFPRTAQEVTALFQDWRCHPDGTNPVEFVEWIGLNPSETMHHHSRFIFVTNVVAPNKFFSTS